MKVLNIVEMQMKKEHTQRRLNLVKEFRKQFITEELPGFLYHYTSIENFKGIVDSQEIWATAADYLLNDPTEITIAKSIASKILEERKKDFSEKKELHKKCKTIIESSDTGKEYQFVCSFTEEGDLLSQWRAYCPQGGVSVGFFVPKISQNDQYLEIKNGSPHNNYYVHENYICKCIYDTQEQKRKINDLLDFLIKYADVGNGQLVGFFNKMIQTFSYSFKHKSFEEEKEWRLCCFVLPEDEQIKYRVKDSMLIPYLPFGIVDKENHSIISKIIVGPSRDKEKLKSSILSYLNDSGVTLSSQDIEVTQTPYQIL
jgi:hypothetical protein